MYFVIGFCGALVCLALFGAGAAAGWEFCRRTRPNPAATDARDELDAFRRLQNYTADDAYGRNQQEE